MIVSSYESCIESCVKCAQECRVHMV
ncbi:four-helix bundle copper-binding protein [Pseudotamlana agarivorans]